MEKLAIDGGNPVRSKNPIVETDVFEEEEFNALMEVAKSKKLRRAEAALEYEKTIADWFEVQACHRCNQRNYCLAYCPCGVWHWTRG